ncbi:hypothetical protein Dda3937_04378 [Dickeya dadantii 3937]|uniref:Uncharacterized protein n=1 Tax=Dickeya dadantii (strain 3937) TaxID=198628 RepID=E0SN78_DICD3|nr:hypothetical protein Dda3937_04378 [Dickeya dadantii 3937]
MGKSWRCLYNLRHFALAGIIILSIPVILQVADALAFLLGPSMGLALYGPLQAAFKSARADLSLTPVTYLCKLPGIRCVAAFLQLELFRV